MPQPPKKRPWFQLHLSTCVVLMVVAGVLVWANTLDRYHGQAVTWGLLDNDDVLAQPEYYGWPKTAVVRNIFFKLTASKEVVNLPQMSSTHFLYPGGLINALVVLGILSGTCFVFESTLRRRERKRAAQEPAP